MKIMRFAAIAALLSAFAVSAADLPAKVYSESGEQGPWVPSGYMGDTGSISMDDSCTDNPHSGKQCLKVVFNKADGWGGVFWQDPANDWGDKEGGVNLTGAKKLTFWVRGKNGGEKVKFSFGGLKDKPYSDTANGEKEVTLTKEWQQVTIDLAGKDLSRIKSGFVWVLAGQGAPVEFYLDDIVYE